MSYRADNAVIMAAGTSSRFASLSYERPKALIQVKGEVLLERQIRQLQEAIYMRHLPELTGFHSIREPHGTEAAGFSFNCGAETYVYRYETGSWRKIQEKGKTGQNVPDGIGTL